jgi:uncharacterized protein YbaR (Trm112 family)
MSPDRPFRRKDIKAAKCSRQRTEALAISVRDFSYPFLCVLRVFVVNSQRSFMISSELLEILRCPMDPSHTRLTLEEDRLTCQRCALVFRIKDGFPVLVVEEAELPPGCESLSQLPCQRERKGVSS